MFILSDQQLAQLRIDITTGTEPFATFYRRLADFGDGQPGVDPNSIVWLRATADVNLGVGSQSDFIRNYNSDQFTLRFGGSLSNGELDDVSDAIALQVFDEVVGTDEDPGIRTIPSIDTLANADARPAAVRLFQGDASGWAGNPLFLFLGHSTSFENNIFESDGDTYDALAMIKVTLDNITGSSFGDLGRQVFTSIPGFVNATFVVTPAVNSLNNYLCCGLWPKLHQHNC